MYLLEPIKPDMDNLWAACHPEEAQKLYAAWYEYHYGERSLRAMCDTGVNRLKASTYFDTLRFDCFNQQETDIVKAYMAATYPEVPFFTTRCV